MKAVAGPIPDGAGWAFEIKWDGMRVVADLGGDDDQAWSGNGRDVLGRFPELHDLGAALGTRVVLDGEVVAFDDRGRSDFGLLQPRMQAADFISAHDQTTPVTFVAFDLLRVGDLPTDGLPYLDRRRLLADLVEPGPGWIVPSHHVGGGADLFDAAAAQGLEGIMAKRTDSAYLPGQRSSAWRKVKVRHRQEVVVGGWSTGTGARASTFGALHIGVHDPTRPDRPLRYAGKVGSGFSDAAIADLVARLTPHRRDDCPFDPPPPPIEHRGVTWFDPIAVVEVEFAHWTAEESLRHPVFLGVRDDKDPREVVREDQPSD
jgi:bifunctional non-homologous end joining protein LigD